MRHTTFAAGGRPAGFGALTSPIDRWARRLVFGQLARLRGGVVVVEDGTGSHRFGDGAGLVGRVRVRSGDFYRKVAFGGSLGAAESYAEGGWDSDDLPTTLRVFARDVARSEAMERGWSRMRGLVELGLHRFRRNSIRGSRRNIHAHYDLSNAFFGLFLDETMNYSAGIFEHAGASMKEASLAKMDRICRKLDLDPDDHLLEIGTGWGGLAIHAATRFGCRVTTTTISAEQYDLARRRVRDAGLESRIRVLKEDYRRLEGIYDKLVSVEMIEAVGHDFLPVYFAQCCRLLASDGLMLLQGIVTPEYRYEDSRRSVDLIRRYIFPGTCLTSVGRISEAIGSRTDFSMLHVEDIGPHYAETLRRWRSRFLENRGAVAALGFDDEFLRLWDYYLSYCEAGFEERIVGDVQMLLARPENRRTPVLGRIGTVPGNPAGAAFRRAS